MREEGSERYQFFFFNWLCIWAVDTKESKKIEVKFERVDR